MKRKEGVQKMINDLGEQPKGISMYDLGWRVGYKFALEEVLKR